MKNKSALFILLFAACLCACEKDPFAGSDNGTFKDSRDSHSYKWSRIGTQIWMAENLAWLPAVSPVATGSETSPLYYVYGYSGTSVTEAKAAANFTSYGALYNFTAAKSACPPEWHTPTDAEWTTLTDFLGGLNAAGLKLKSTSGWNTNGNGDNSSGFNGLPAGGRDHQYGFIALSYLGVFYSATENTSTTAWHRGLSYTGSAVNRVAPVKSDAYSVRCLKD